MRKPTTIFFKIEFDTEIRKLVVGDIIICSIQLLLRVFLFNFIYLFLFI